MAAAGPSTAAAPARVPVESRSTELVSSLAVLASSSLQDHIADYADAHRWIDSFFDKIDRKAAPGPGASRCVLSTVWRHFSLARNAHEPFAMYTHTVLHSPS